MTLGKVKQACCAAKLWCDVLPILMYQSKVCLKKKNQEACWQIQIMTFTDGSLTVDIQHAVLPPEYLEVADIRIYFAYLKGRTFSICLKAQNCASKQFVIKKIRTILYYENDPEIHQ